MKDAGLAKSGDVYALADETPVLDGVKALRLAKVQADKESRQRKVIELQITAKKKIMKEADKEWHELETKLGVITDVSIHNRVVTRMNRLVADHKQAMADGNIIEGREMTIKTVRVGRFTLEEVRCVVLNKGLPNPPLILGGSFLNHFIVRLDPGSRELHLTEIKDEGQVKAAPAGPKAAPPIKPTEGKTTAGNSKA